MAPPRGGDLRTPAQRRADALATIVNQVLGAGGLPTVHGVRPHLDEVARRAHAVDPEGLALPLADRLERGPAARAGDRDVGGAGRRGRRPQAHDRVAPPGREPETGAFPPAAP